MTTTTTASTPSPRRVLLTGAAGVIGSAFFQYAEARYRWRLADRRSINLTGAANAGHETIALDIVDLVACQAACQDMDTVVHLAADANPAADFYGSLLDNNIKGTYNIFRAARDQGCRRVIFASSAWVMGGYAPDVQLAPDAPVRPSNLYGVSKCFGEAIAAYFAYAEGLSSIVVRIGAHDPDPGGSPHLERSASTLATYVSARDLNQLLVRCIEAPDLTFAIVHGVSGNRFTRLDLTSARVLLGYDPRDDAFTRFADDLTMWLRG